MSMTIMELIQKGYKSPKLEVGLRGAKEGQAFRIDQITVIIYNYSRKKCRITVSEMGRHIESLYLSYNSQHPLDRRKTPSRNQVSARMEQLYSIEKLDREKEIKEDGYKRWVYYDPEVKPAVATFDRGDSITLNLFDMGLLGVEAMGADKDIIAFIRNSRTSLPFPCDFYDILDMLVDRASGIKDFNLVGLEATMREFANLLNIKIK